MKSKEAVVISLLIVAIVLSSVSIGMNVHLNNEIKPYLSSTPTGNIVFEILPPQESAELEVEEELDEIG